MRLKETFKVRLFFVAATMLLVGCQASHPVEGPFLAPPASAVAVNHFIGTPLSGATLTKPPATILPADAWSIQVRFVALEHMVGGVGQPVASKARMIVQSGRAFPVMPAERLLRGVRWVDLKDPAGIGEIISPAAGHTLLISDVQGALPASVTASFTLKDATSLQDAGSSAASHRRIEVDAYRSPTNTMQIGLAVADLADQSPDRTDLGEQNKSSEGSQGEAAKPAPKKSGIAGFWAALTSGSSTSTTQPASSRNASGARKQPPAAPTPSMPPIFQRELAIIDLPPVSTQGESAAILVPMHFTNTDAAAIAAVITIGPASRSPDHVAATARCAEDLQRSADAAANSPQALTVVSPEWSIYRVALDALTDPNRRRSALVYLAMQTGAPLCRDVALAADPPTLEHLSGEVRRVVARPAGSATPGAEELGWTLDRTTYAMLSELLNKTQLPLELMGVLTAFTGEVGRDAGSVDEVSHSMGSRAQFMARLQAENLISLEDSSLAARVRAYDWLRARGEAPPGYDPQALRKDRRDALEKFAATPTTAPAGADK
jgi:hypothetical protein